MRLGISLLALATLCFAFAAWDPATGEWSPHTALYFLDVSQLVYVAGPSFLFAAIVHSPSALLRAIVMAFGGHPHAEKGEIISAMRALEFLGGMALRMGTLVTLIEAVISAQNSASLTGFILALGVSLLALLYGLLARTSVAMGIQVLKNRLGPFVFYGQ